MLLDRCDRQGRVVSSSKNSIVYAPRVFVTWPGRDGCTQENFEAAMEALFADGAIIVEPDRDMKHRIRRGQL
jgi:hypothetical protein